MPIFNPILVSKKAKTSSPLDPVEVYKNTRPADWLPMPEPADNEMYLLFHIPDGVSSLLAFTVTCTGDYTVALGTVSGGLFSASNSKSVASGSKYEAELFANDYGSLTSTGMKQVMVKISGTDILTWETSTHSKKASPPDFASWNIVEISCRLSKGTKVICGNETEFLMLKTLKYFSWYGVNECTDMSYMFYGCSALAAIPQLDTSNVTSMYNMFIGCNSLTTIPQLNTSNVTSMGGMFSSCYSLTTIPQLDTSNVTGMSNMFGSCYSLTTIPLLNTSAVRKMGVMFKKCYSLTTIPQLDTSNVTSMSSMFFGCDSLTTIPQLDTSNVTDMSSMFYGCDSLTTIPQLDTSNVTDISSMFENCYSLTAIPALDISMTGAFDCCYSLSAISFNPFVTDWAGDEINLSDCSLGHTAIVALFNSLPAITSSQALTLTGNPGVSELTDEEKAIATGKNWTLTL